MSELIVIQRIVWTAPEKSVTSTLVINSHWSADAPVGGFISATHTTVTSIGGNGCGAAA